MVIRQTGSEAIVVTEPQTTEDVQCPAAFPTFLPMKVYAFQAVIIFCRS